MSESQTSHLKSDISDLKSPPSPLARGYGQVKLMLGMIRFSHTLFALPFALMAALMAWTQKAADVHLINVVAEHSRSFVSRGILHGPLVQSVAIWRWRDLLGIVLCMVF